MSPPYLETACAGSPARYPADAVAKARAVLLRRRQGIPGLRDDATRAPLSSLETQP
jgi:hypothetical protein